MLLEKLPHAVALRDRVALLEERRAKQAREVRVVGDERLVLERIGFELGERDIGVGAWASTGVEIKM